MGERLRIAKDAPRPYQLRRRREAMAETRRRIIDAAVRLHGSVGPARTTMTAVAEGAGVTRATLYRHFPTDGALFLASRADWFRQHPPPDADAWQGIPDPERRLRWGLRDVYAWFRATEAMTVNVLRDLAELPPANRAGIAAATAARRMALADGWVGANERLRSAAIGHALAFETWRSLAGQGLEDEEVIELMVGLVLTAGG